MDERIRSEKRRWRDTDRFSLSIQMIGLVVILLIASTVLIRVYSRSVQASIRTEVLNKSIVLTRNAAEIYRANGDLSDIAQAYRSVEGNGTLTVNVDRDLQPTGEKEGWLVLEMQEEADDTLHTLHMQVKWQGDPERTDVYDLDVTVFVPQGGAADGN